MGLRVLEVVLGAIVAFLTTILIENLRKPELRLRTAQSGDVQYQGRPATLARFLGLELMNNPRPRWARWMSRNVAIQCHGTITFYHLDGQDIFGRSMPIRWSNSPEPVPIHFAVGDKQILIVDPAKLNLAPRMDVCPGESERLDVAGRFDNESERYGWSNENCFAKPIWRNPNWKMPVGRFLVRVNIVSAGEKCTGVFRLINDVPQKDFRIEAALPNDTVRD